MPVTYTTRAEHTVVGGRVRDFLAREQRLLTLARTQPGFQTAVVLNSLGYTGKYVRLIRWDNRALQRAWVRSDAISNFVQTDPGTDLYVTGSRPGEAYDSILDVDSEASPATIVGLVDWTLKPDAATAEAWIANRKALFELGQRHGRGFVSAGIRRFLGSPGRYLVVRGWADEDAGRDTQAVGEIREYVAANPVTDYLAAPTMQETFEVVVRV